MTDSSFSEQENSFSNTQDWFDHGCDLYASQQYEQAIAAFDRVIESDSEHFEAWFNRAAILHRLERYEEAIASYTRAIAINSDNSTAFFSRGLIFSLLEQYVEALEDYDMALELEPDNLDVWESRVGVLNALGRYDEAEVSHARCISLSAKLYPSLAVPKQKLPAVDELVVIDGHTDFTKAFHDGYTFYQDVLNFGTSEVTFSTYEIGELNLTSGQIVACDPSLEEAFRCPFIQSVEPGQYPVFLSVAYEEVSGYAQIACAMLRFSKEEAIRWELAPNRVTGSSKTGEVYGVDSGKGCFMDVDAAEVLYELKSFTLEEQAGIDAARLTGDTEQHLEVVSFASDRCQTRFQQEFADRLNTEMDSNERCPPGQRWANIRVSPSTEANIVAFSSGYGDGAYASYWGYDAAENLVCLVTDFALFSSAS